MIFKASSGTARINRPSRAIPLTSAGNHRLSRMTFHRGKWEVLTKKSEKYLRKIIAYAKKKQTPLLLISAPYVITKEDKMTYNQIAEIAAQEDVTFIDFNEYYEDMGLDFTTDFNDESHLNYHGSVYLQDYLGNYLKENYILPDRRGDPSCESYLDNQKLILKEVKEASATG